MPTDPTIPGGLPGATEFASYASLLHAPALIGLIVGLILWLVGGRVLKPAVVLLGAAGGALAGSVIAPRLLDGSIAGAEPAWIGMAVGGLIGLGAAVAVFRVAMAAAGAGVFAAVGILGALVYLNFQPGGLELRDQGGAQTVSLRDRVVESATRVAMNSAADRATGATDEEQSASLHAAAGAEAKSLWAAVPEESRLLLASVAFAAGLAGMLIGALMPVRAASIVTALMGSAVALASAVWLAGALQIQWVEPSRVGPVGWLAAWAMLAAAGVYLQGSRRKAAA